MPIRRSDRPLGGALRTRQRQPARSNRPRGTAPRAAATQKTAPPKTAPPKTAAPPKTPDAKDPAVKKPPGFSLFGGVKDLTRGLSDKLDGLTAALGPKPTPQERVALEKVRAMLEPNKLGGGDRTFNFADKDAVVSSLMRDTEGLKREVPAQLRAEGKDFQANLAERGLGGSWGPLAQVAKGKVYEEAPGQIGGQLEAGLREAKIDPATGRQPDNVRRDISFAELRRFEENAEILQNMQTRMSKQLGLDITFPGGLSAASLDHTLQGRGGFPPGAKVKPRP